jgi:hypothetical protein
MGKPLKFLALKGRLYLNQPTQDSYTSRLLMLSQPVRSERSRASGEVEECVPGGALAFDFASLRSGRTRSVLSGSGTLYERLVVRFSPGHRPGMLVAARIGSQCPRGNRVSLQPRVGFGLAPLGAAS